MKHLALGYNSKATVFAIRMLITGSNLVTLPTPSHPPLSPQSCFKDYYFKHPMEESNRNPTETLPRVIKTNMKGMVGWASLSYSRHGHVHGMVSHPLSRSLLPASKWMQGFENGQQSGGNVAHSGVVVEPLSYRPRCHLDANSGAGGRILMYIFAGFNLGFKAGSRNKQSPDYSGLILIRIEMNS